MLAQTHQTSISITIALLLAPFAIHSAEDSQVVANICELHHDGTCAENISLSSVTSQLVLPTQYGEPQKIEDTPYSLREFQEMELYMLETIYKDNAFISVRESCRNEESLCMEWAMAGECSKNPRYMQYHCAPACRSCQMLSYELRCQQIVADSMSEEDVWKPGDLDKTFRRIIEDNHYQRYQPVVLSQPGDINPFSLSDSPWIVLLENFVTPNECEQLIQLGQKRGYERSKTIGKGRSKDGKLEQNQNYPGRTSKNAWCIDECYQDPVAQQVIERISNLTGIYDHHAEYMQLLRYDVGDFYETHHDFVPQLHYGTVGPRILTVFLYLNDVEAGGATLFSDLNITVLPKRGSAVIWPSVLDARPNERDKRLYHAALPVEQGIKYGANVWVSVHLRLFLMCF